MEKFQSLLSPASLLVCNESVACLDEEEDGGIDEIASIIDDDEYIKMLLDREIIDGGLQVQGFSQSFGGDWIHMARLDGIQYILRRRVLLGFKSQTAYLAVTYLDRFLSRRSIDADKSWAVGLLSMACLSLAAKMEECEVPGLSDFCVEDYSFESKIIQRMELLVLNSLEWKMGSITPFHFTHFFVKIFCQNSPSRNLFSRIFEVILGATRDVKIMCHMPSVISAAATLFVMDQNLTRNALELKISPLALTGDQKIEDVTSCYYQVQEMENERIRLDIEGIKSPELTPIQLQRLEANGTTSSVVTSIASGKRKRLEFNNNDQKQ
ncbi:hypothetical protein ACJIZ3_025076 [Penstemon smallii]|uniref:Cyclin-like domain-containing protein n=1 Tax=Penstemon smallii TaxID=265156 RepID=A0ABD3TTY3_9LAMI